MAVEREISRDRWSSELNGNLNGNLEGDLEGDLEGNLERTTGQQSRANLRGDLGALNLMKTMAAVVISGNQCQISGAISVHSP